MAHQASERNPFMLMMNPEVVIAAMEKSERLGQLRRQLCRPLDRPVSGGGAESDADLAELADEQTPNRHR